MLTFLHKFSLVASTFLSGLAFARLCKTNHYTYFSLPNVYVVDGEEVGKSSFKST